MPEMLRTLVGDKYFETLVTGAFADGEGYHGLMARAPEKARKVLLCLSGVDTAVFFRDHVEKSEGAQVDAQ
eukprot:2089946-Alexandrium_andersonii.AAC.1